MEYHFEEKRAKVVKAILSCKTMQHVDCCYRLIELLGHPRTQLKLLYLLETIIHVNARKSFGKYETPTN